MAPALNPPEDAEAWVSPVSIACYPVGVAVPHSLSASFPSECIDEFLHGVSSEGSYCFIFFPGTT